MGIKIKPESAEKIIRRLRKNGFIFLHQKGSHKYYCRKTRRRNYLTCVPIHSGDIPVGTIASIIRQAGLTRTEFYKK